METLPTALVLFERFAPEFSEIQLIPAAWKWGSGYDCVYLTTHRLDGRKISFGSYPAWIDLSVQSGNRFSL